MSFSINSYSPGRDSENDCVDLGTGGRNLPFPTDAWRRMVGGPAASHTLGRVRSVHPAEQALKDVERQLDHAARAFDETIIGHLESAVEDAADPDGWHPRAA
ncbi:MAG: hypothetical protein L6Q35_11390 [Phycisphaerales bacterium]|nr:hypothetical protein [Phycisphaerales bacterium]